MLPARKTVEQPPRLIVCKRQTHGTFCWFRRDADTSCIRLKDCLHSDCGIATRGAARTFSEGMRRSTVAHFARKVRGTNIVAAKHVGCSKFRKSRLTKRRQRPCKGLIFRVGACPCLLRPIYEPRPCKGLISRDLQRGKPRQRYAPLTGAAARIDEHCGMR